MKISCLRRAISALPKIVLDKEPAIALNQFLSHEEVDWENEANSFILFVDSCAADWNLVHLVAVVPPVLNIWPYEPEIWAAAGKRMENLEKDGFAHPEFFTSDGDEFLMWGDPIWFTLARVTGRDSEGWSESETVPIEVRHPGQFVRFDLQLNLQYIAVIERLLDIETVYAHA